MWFSSPTELLILIDFSLEVMNAVGFCVSCNFDSGGGSSGGFGDCGPREGLLNFLSPGGTMTLLCCMRLMESAISSCTICTFDCSGKSRFCSSAMVVATRGVHDSKLHWN